MIHQPREMAVASDVPDPDSSIHEISGIVYNNLVNKLKKQDAWRTLAASVGIFEEESLEQKSCPVTAILNELDARLCKVKHLKALLLRCDLHDAVAVLSEPQSIVIEVQPGEDDEDVYIAYGGELRLEVVALGVPPPQYLWFCDNEELSDQRKSVLQISGFGPQHAGEYKCLVFQDGLQNISVFSNPVNVMMLPEPPVIQEQPEPATVNCGEDVTFSCKAVSYPLPTYEWMHDNTILVGENNPVLKIPKVSQSASGVYKCYVSNGYNVTVTNAVKLTVYNYPSESACEKPELPIVTEKVALLIANAAYANLRGLLTPYNDVKALANILKGLGFKVVSLCDLTLTEMTNAVKMFCDLIPEGAYAIFYFAGHGFELHNKYMLPVECPSPDTYLCSDSLCERHVIREILAKKPNLLLIMLDMCLKMPKREENPRLHQEQIDPISYEAQRNLIQAYATTSNFGAYERISEKYGIYMKHLLQFLSEDKPIVDILQKVIESVSKEKTDAVDLQMPSLTTNVVPQKHYLSVPSTENPTTKELFEKLTCLEKKGAIYFPELKHWSHLKFQYDRECFLNAIEIHFYGLNNWRICCEVQTKVVEMHITFVNNVKILTILNLQKLKTPSLSMTVGLRDDRGTLVDNAWFEINNIPIATAHLWFSPPIVDDQSEENSELSLYHDPLI